MKRSQSYIFLSIAIALFAQCTQNKEAISEPVFLGQGVMSGEATDQSIILQARLTASDTLIDGYLPGREGVLQFVLSTEAELEKERITTEWLIADSLSDYIVKIKIKDLKPNQRYYYRAEYGLDAKTTRLSPVGYFRTNPGADIAAPLSFAVVTGMNYYHFHYGKYDPATRYQGEDKHLGYPALEAVKALEPDYFIGTGDNVYFDHPSTRDFQRAIERGKKPLKGLFDGKEVVTEAGMRRKYHVQFVQPRFKALFRQTATYWEKDDHDYRVNDGDPYSDFPISHELGIKNFKEQLPVVDPTEADALTYRTIRMSRDVQIWLLEGRDYRDANDKPDGPDKTLWGAMQKEWLKKTLLESTAAFKIIVSPTPMVGPDDAYKKDNHTNLQGFRHEGEAFFSWLKENDFLNKNLYFVCGDRHWQYHAVHPSGFEEFSTGALVDANSRAGRLAGDPNSTDPEAKIEQKFVQGTTEEASGGFLMVKHDPAQNKLIFTFYDEKGRVLYEAEKISIHF